MRLLLLIIAATTSLALRQHEIQSLKLRMQAKLRGSTSALSLPNLDTDGTSVCTTGCDSGCTTGCDKNWGLSGCDSGCTTGCDKTCFPLSSEEEPESEVPVVPEPEPESLETARALTPEEEAFKIKSAESAKNTAGMACEQHNDCIGTLICELREGEERVCYSPAYISDDGIAQTDISASSGSAWEVWNSTWNLMNGASLIAAEQCNAESWDPVTITSDGSADGASEEVLAWVVGAYEAAEAITAPIGFAANTALWLSYKFGGDDGPGIVAVLQEMADAILARVDKAIDCASWETTSDISDALELVFSASTQSKLALVANAVADVDYTKCFESQTTIGIEHLCTTSDYPCLGASGYWEKIEAAALDGLTTFTVQMELLGQKNSVEAVRTLLVLADSDLLYTFYSIYISALSNKLLLETKCVMHGERPKLLVGDDIHAAMLDSHRKEVIEKAADYQLKATEIASLVAEKATWFYRDVWMGVESTKMYGGQMACDEDFDGDEGSEYTCAGSYTTHALEADYGPNTASECCGYGFGVNNGGESAIYKKVLTHILVDTFEASEVMNVQSASLIVAPTFCTEAEVEDKDKCFYSDEGENPSYDSQMTEFFVDTNPENWRWIDDVVSEFGGCTSEEFSTFADDGWSDCASSKWTPALSRTDDGLWANWWSTTPNAAISGFNNKRLKSVSVEDCKMACLEVTDFVCVSFDYHKNSLICDLSDKRGTDVGGLKTNYPGNPYDHYSLDFPARVMIEGPRYNLGTPSMGTNGRIWTCAESGHATGPCSQSGKDDMTYPSFLEVRNDYGRTSDFIKDRGVVLAPKSTVQYLHDHVYPHLLRYFRRVIVDPSNAMLPKVARIVDVSQAMVCPYDTDAAAMFPLLDESTEAAAANGRSSCYSEGMCLEDGVSCISW